MKKILSVILFVFFAGTCLAENVAQMVIKCKSSTIEAPLSNVGMISYDDETTMHITYIDGTEDLRLTIDDIVSVKFTNSDISTTVRPMLSEKAVADGIYTIDGKFVRNVKSGSVTEMINKMETGTYIIVAGDRQIKIRKN